MEFMLHEDGLFHYFIGWLFYPWSLKQYIYSVLSCEQTFIKPQYMISSL